MPFSLAFSPRGWVVLALLSVSLAGPCPVGRAADLIVVPGGYEDRPGEGGGGFGFVTLGTARYQEVIAAREFFSVPGSLLITGLAMREGAFGGRGYTGWITNEIRFSTTAKVPDGLSLVFGENVGPDDTVVLEAGHGTFFGGSFGNVGFPQRFDSRISFTHPFLYNPQAGNLLFDMRSYGTHYEFPGPGSIDGASSLTDGVSGVGAIGVDSVRGEAFTAAYIFQFEYTLVPEPGVMALLATACGLLLLLPRSRNHLKLFFSSGTHPRQGSHSHVSH